MVAKLLPLIPEHRIYVEVFGGGGSLLLAKPPSLVEVYNDLDGRLVNLFRVLRDPDQFAEFERLACFTAFSRQEFDEAKAGLEEGNPVERAWKFYVVGRQSFSGLLETWGYGRSSSARGMAGQCSKWIGSIEGLPELHLRLMRVQIERDDWRKILKRFDSPETFFYLDPPYVPKTRKSGGYKHELSEKDHAELVEKCQKLEGKVLLSGYPNEIYQPLEATWRMMTWRTACHAAGRTRGTKILGVGSALAKQSRTEAVWMNY